ncbi:MULTISPECIES: protein translocase subunit SecD [Acidithiobacillus]|jgi:preprotein translocase subunit SecD|uniref:Protein translocase subunit SecD n=3 Tax=Acidithiobacillus TaxID=119977 RepID=A0A179B757_ACIFR|nr:MULTISPECIES: protein translocase subunit SecD [Acidithiobacillus]MDA8153943.1 protein translocase subunit SecD [Acidithiobacillus sp.]MBU2830528.1 protein translocase subunit SecD [Acidithiobacillus ferriphilus]MBU2833604.1 protein translocase subunit SecD [Acidithiobacillus ferriphilus]MBU2853946.1 protein translocase subunit SecD [Acidithiobacillus ferriphilus]MBW9249275.1 protein translocase subunit SecD [Acidithiobacillus ferriphilus]
MTRYPWWKYLIILAVVLPSLFYALPNFYGWHSAVEVRAPAGTLLPPVATMRGWLQAANVPVTRVNSDGTGSTFFFPNNDAQGLAETLLQSKLPGNAQVILSQMSAEPDWLSSLGGKPVNLGLDLRGGVYLLLRVDTDAVIKHALEQDSGSLRTFLRHQNLQYLAVNVTGPQNLAVEMENAAVAAQAQKVIAGHYPDYAITLQPNAVLDVSLTPDAARKMKDDALQQAIVVIRNRIDELGVSEPVIQRQGAAHIAVQLPGVQDTQRAKSIIGSTAQLEFKMVDEQANMAAALKGDLPPGTALFYGAHGAPYVLYTNTVLTGRYLSNASAGVDNSSGQAIVNVSFNNAGTRIFGDLTTKNVGKRMAILLDNKVVTAPVIREAITGGRAQITGFSGLKDASNAAIELRAGALPAPVHISEERTVGPTLGQDSIHDGVMAVVFGMLFVVLFMTFYYRAFGLIADLAILVNVLAILAVLSIMGGTLTLPGIAGIVLKIGLAVDANVLVFERIREELRHGMSTRAAIDAGFKKAFATIVDSNVTVLIAALVLFQFGTGAIKGFALVLTIGVITSMFTATMMSRGIIELALGKRRVQKLYI